jgi:hypothetical protein
MKAANKAHSIKGSIRLSWIVANEWGKKHSSFKKEMEKFIKLICLQKTFLHLSLTFLLDFFLRLDPTVGGVG